MGFPMLPIWTMLICLEKNPNPNLLGHYAFDLCYLLLMTDDSISFGHYAVPFELCHLWLMIQFHLDTMPCHLNYASYEKEYNFIWTLCRAIWTMLIMSERFNFIWTLCRAIWTIVSERLNCIWTLCRANWTMLIQFIWSVPREFVGLCEKHEWCGMICPLLECHDSKYMNAC